MSGEEEVTLWRLDWNSQLAWFGKTRHDVLVEKWYTKVLVIDRNFRGIRRPDIDVQYAQITALNSLKDRGVQEEGFMQLTT